MNNEYLNDKILAWLLLLTGLSISTVAIYYSVLGLAAIFAAAVIPIVVMGTILELSKLVAAWWLKANWHRAPVLLKSYMLLAVLVLMLITSMGIFGFLSKAHNDQSLVSGDVQSKIAIYDEKIKTAKDNIEAARKALRQMDEAVDQTMARSTSEEGATKATNLRRAQSRERSTLTREIEANQKIIATLNEESAPIRAEVRKVEAEVGPIKYIAAFIYGDNPDANLLEKAVTWVIIIIVIVFDPLAVILLLASQLTFQWARKEKDSYQEEMASDLYEMDKGLPEPETTGYVNSPWPFKVQEEQPVKEEVKEEESAIEGITVEQWNKMIEEAEKAAVKEIVQEKEQIVEPTLEPIEEPKKEEVTYIEKVGKEQITKVADVTYSQNSEQSENSIWYKVKDSKEKVQDIFTPLDRIYRFIGSENLYNYEFPQSSDAEYNRIIDLIIQLKNRNIKPEELSLEDRDVIAEILFRLSTDVE